MTTGERSHEALEELIAADALGALSGDERRAMLDEMATHGGACQECGRLVADYREVAGRLALLAEPVALSAGAPDTLRKRARDASPVAGGVTPPGRMMWGRRWVAAAAVA